MSSAEMLSSVKNALGIEGTYQDNTISVYIAEVMDFLTVSGVPAELISAGLVSRGVSDLWNYGASNGKLSQYFVQRAAQLALKAGASDA